MRLAAAMTRRGELNMLHLLLLRNRSHGSGLCWKRGSLGGADAFTRTALRVIGRVDSVGIPDIGFLRRCLGYAHGV